MENKKGFNYSFRDNNYLIQSYNFIWSRAFEVMVKCDILSDWCSLSQNDIGLIDLIQSSFRKSW